MKDHSLEKPEEALHSASDRLFPAEIGKRKVHLDSSSSDGDTALHVFIWGNETENSILLIENGIDINAADDMGETPLHAALHQNNIAVERVLLQFNM